MKDENIRTSKVISELSKSIQNATSRELETILINDSVIRSKSLNFNDVLHQFEKNRFVAPCVLDQREIINFEHYAIQEIPDIFELIELSPVTSFGSNSVLTGTSQKKILSTNRNTEVLADAVTTLALEAAKRRRRNSAGQVLNLGSFHREIRTQKYNFPGFTSHFHALSLISSSKTKNADDFKTQTFTTHLKCYLNIIQRSSKIGYKVKNLSVKLSNIRIIELIVHYLDLDKKTIIENTKTPDFSFFKEYKIDLPSLVSINDLYRLSLSLPHRLYFLSRSFSYLHKIFQNFVDEVEISSGSAVEVYFDLERHEGVGYYKDVCAKISAYNSKNESYPLVDIGFSDWTKKILNDSSERLITGGMGTELFMKKFYVGR